MDLQTLKNHSLIRLVDDDSEVLDALSFLLDCEGWKTACYSSAERFLAEDRPSAPGCLLLDIRMPGLSGIELQRLMAEKSLDLPIIFITGHADIDTAVDVLRRGAVDFLQKPVNEARLLESITEACTLNMNRDSGVWSKEKVQQVLGELSPREREVADLLREGLTNSQIAERLGLSLRSVQGHRNNMYRKLKVHSTADFLKRLENL